MRSVKRTRPVEKGKEKAMDEKENTAEREDLEAKELIERARVQVAPNVGAGGSHTQATSDP